MMKGKRAKSAQPTRSSIQEDSRFQMTVENMNSAFAILSPVRDNSAHITDFIYQYVNRKRASISNIPLEEMTGARLSELFPQIKASPLFQAYCSAVDTRTPQILHSQDCKKEIRDPDISYTYDISAAGFDDGVIVIWNQITDNLQNETERPIHSRLKLSEEFFRLIAENSFILISVNLADGNYIYSNRATQNYYGVSEKEVLKINPFKLIHPDDTDKLTEHLKRGNIAEPIEIRLRNKDGEYSWFEASVCTITIQGDTYIIGMGIVIDSRKEAEETLHKQLRMNKAFFNQAESGFVLLDHNFNYIRVNEAFAGYYKKNPEDFKGKYFQDVAPFGKRGFDMLNHVLQTKRKAHGFAEPYVVEDLPGKDIHYFDWTLQPILDEHGEVEFLFFSANDVTKRKRAEEALSKSETKFRELAESITDFFFAMDQDLNYTYWNKASEITSGVAAQNAIGRSLFDLFPDTKGTIVEEFYRNVLRTQKPDNMIYEYRIMGKDYVFEVNAYPIHNGISVFVKDITERKRAEETLLKYKQIVSTTPDGVALLDKSYRYEIINNTYEKFSGLTRDQIIGHTVEEYLGSEIFNNVIKEKFDRCLNGETIQYEEWFEYENAGKRFIRVTYFPYRNTKNEIAGVVAVSQDVTALKNSELKLQKYAEELKRYGENLEELVKKRTSELEMEKERAESADRLKSAFLAAMSHELRTPLNSIIGFTGILMQRRPGQLNDEQVKQLGMVQNSARHLLSLINDILDLSKIEVGQLNVSFERFNLPDIINKVVEITGTPALKKNLSLNVSIDHDIKEIVSDKLRVQQILLNLVNNAIKFTEKGSVSIVCSRNVESVIIKIIDTGIGIEKERLKDIFHPFVQIDTGLARKHEGTGLGLSISQKLINRLEGTIDVESQYGKGSIFTVTLPLRNKD